MVQQELEDFNSSFANAKFLANVSLWHVFLWLVRYVILNVPVGRSGGLSLICKPLTLSDNQGLASVPTKVPEEISPVTVGREWMWFKSAQNSCSLSPA